MKGEIKESGVYGNTYYFFPEDENLPSVQLNATRHYNCKNCKYSCLHPVDARIHIEHNEGHSMVRITPRITEDEIKYLEGEVIEADESE